MFKAASLVLSRNGSDTGREDDVVDGDEDASITLDAEIEDDCGEFDTPKSGGSSSLSGRAGTSTETIRTQVTSQDSIGKAITHSLIVSLTHPLTHSLTHSLDT